MKRVIALILCLMLLTPSAVLAEGFQSCHRITLTEEKTTQRNGSEVHLWKIDTVSQKVDGELNALVKGFADDIAPTLPAPGASSSRLNVIIRPSRTGLSWMSFMVQARSIANTQTKGVRFTTRTYDMKTGERVLLTDIFPADSAAWEVLAQRIEDTAAAYFPGEKPNASALTRATTRESIEQMDFTLHGMSLVLHLDAAKLYPGRKQLIEVTLYYPELREMMTERARTETDNLRYYKTVALTFDDGPNGWCTDQVLLALMKGGERATFFLVGERVKQQAYLVQREHDEGHAIASHNWQHVYANNTAASVLRSMPAKVDAVHNEVIGIPVRYARAPGGQWENMAKAGMGWPLIQWTVEAADWQGTDGPEPNMTAANIVAGTDDGGIILMHDLKRNSAAAAEKIIERLQEQGYIFLTIDELFAKDGVALQPDTAYWRCTDGKTTR